jgi:hypothetical protein
MLPDETTRYLISVFNEADKLILEFDTAGAEFAVPEDDSVWTLTLDRPQVDTSALEALKKCLGEPSEYFIEPNDSECVVTYYGDWTDMISIRCKSASEARRPFTIGDAAARYDILRKQYLHIYEGYLADGRRIQKVREFIARFVEDEQVAIARKIEHFHTRNPEKAAYHRGYLDGATKHDNSISQLLNTKS